MSSEDEFTSPNEYFGSMFPNRCPHCNSDNVDELVEDELYECLDCGEKWKGSLQKRVRCPKCKSHDVCKLNGEFEDIDEYECNRCGETWKISVDGTIY